MNYQGALYTCYIIKKEDRPMTNTTKPSNKITLAASTLIACIILLSFSCDLGADLNLDISPTVFTGTNLAGGLKNISTAETTNSTFTVQYTTPTSSEIAQVARTIGSSNPRYTGSVVNIVFRKATATEVDNPSIPDISDFYKSVGLIVNKDFIFTSTAQTQDHVIKNLLPDIRYFYIISVSHNFEQKKGDFIVKEGQLIEAKTLP